MTATADGRLGPLAALESAALDALRRHYRGRDLAEASVPVVVGITGACENVSTLVPLAGTRRAHLTQTGQLALEHALCGTDGVFCVTRSFRTDRVDHRHLNEFNLVEEELACTHPAAGLALDGYDDEAMFEVLLSEMEAAMRCVIGVAVGTGARHLEALGADPGRLAEAAERPFHRVDYGEAVELLCRDGMDPQPCWGDDLRQVHEVRLLELIAARQGTGVLPTFVTRYPLEIKFFNMRASRRASGVVLSADLLLPGVGEAIGGAVREHEHDRLHERLVSSTMLRHIREQGLGDVSDFEPYLALVRGGRTAPHAGYGLGLERALQYVLGETDIRRCSVPYLLSEAMGFTAVLEDLQPGARSPGF